MFKQWILPLLLLFAVGCQRDLLHPDDLKLVVSPGLVLPLGQLSLNLDDVVPADTGTVFQLGTTPFYTVSYHEDSLIGISVEDLFTLPTQPPISLGAKLGNLALPPINTATSITLGNLSSNITNPTTFASAIQGAQGTNAPFPSIPVQNPGKLATISLGTIQSADFQSGNLILTLTNGFPAAVNATVALTNNQGVELVTYTFLNVAPGDSSTAIQNLAGVSLPGSLDVRLKNLSSPGAGTTGVPSTYVPIDTADALEMVMVGSSLIVHSATTVTSSQTIVDSIQWTGFNVPNGIEITEVGIQTGSLDYSISSALPEPVVVNLSLPGSQTNWGAAWTQTITILPNSTSSGTFPWSNLALDMSQNSGQPYNSLPISYEVLLLSTGQTVVVDSSQSIGFSFEMKNLVMDYVYGYFGNDSLELPRDTVEVDFPFLDKLSGSIVFSEPSLTITFSSETSLGIPISLDLDVASIKNDGTSVELSGATSTIINHPVLISQLGQNMSTAILFGPNNSSIADVLEWPKKAITYGGTVTYNKDTTATGRFNYISSTSSLKVGADFLLPVAIQISDLRYVDSLDVSNLKELLDVDTSTALSAMLRVHSESYLPIDAALNLRFYSDSGQLVWVESVPLVHSAFIDPVTGLVSQPSIMTDILTIDTVGIEQISRAKWMEIEASLETSNGGQEPVKLDANNGLNIYLELEVEMEKQIL